MNRLGLYLEKLSLIILVLFLVSFPFVLTNLTTEFYVLPKQILLSSVAILLLVTVGLKWVIDKEIRLRRTPFDLPILLFLGVCLVSSLLSVNRSESLISFAPVLFAGLLYFAITNTVKDKLSFYILLGAFLVSSSLLALNTILNFARLYFWPFDFTKTQTFTPLGSLLDQGVYLATALSLALFLLVRSKPSLKLKKFFNKNNVLLLLAALLSLVGLGVTIYMLIAMQRPVILPYAHGFQISFAAISQDTGRLLQSFLFGSGFGTFASDYARFKQASINLTSYWSLNFIRSSSFVLELLATTGVVGILSFGYLALKVVKEKPLFIPGLLYLVAALVLPLSFATQALLFLILGIHTTWLGLSSNKIFEIELAIVTLKKGLVGAFTANSKTVPHGGLSRALPFLIFIIILAVTGLLGFMTTRYALANEIFQKSILATQENKGTEAYQQQSRAISLVGYNDAYQRVFSQTNLALANSLSQEAQKQASPSAETRQTIYTLIQQAINSGRYATDLAPATSLNWQNLSSIYRALIGFGRNADQFAVQAQQQAVKLDPNNPQQYINLGGLYYQLKEWDKAIEQFRLAINIKPDFANAYYNLAYSMKEKGDLEGAIAQLNIVKDLVKNDKSNLDKVTAEIKALEAGLKGEEAPETVQTLPPQEPPLPIEPPVEPTPTPAQPTPTPQQ